MLYVSPSDPVAVDCAGVSDTPVYVTPPSYTFTFFSRERSWAATYEITAGRARHHEP